MILAALAVTASLTCPPLAGADALFQHPDTKVIWVGEVHGTTEQPALFGDIVCYAGKTGRPLVVVLERSQIEQPAWDAFMASNGDAETQAAFLRGAEWVYPLQDGRSSQAMFALAKRLRDLKAAGAAIQVRLMLSSERETAAENEAFMAKTVEAAEPGALVLAYSGNFHAKKGTNTFKGETYKLAAALLPPSDVISVNLAGEEGTAWNCQGVVCGPHRYGSSRTHGRGVVIVDPPAGFDAEGYTGTATTASPPAARPATPIPLPSS